MYLSTRGVGTRIRRSVTRPAGEQPHHKVTIQIGNSGTAAVVFITISDKAGTHFHIVRRPVSAIEPQVGSRA